MQAAIPLEMMQSGETGRICDVDGRADDVARIEEMGLRCGTSVRMVKAGSPCLLAIGNHRLSLRCDGVVCILVEIETPLANSRP